MEDNLQVSFCDLCNSSIAEKDLEEGRVTRVNGKVLGTCCVPFVPPGDPRLTAAGRDTSAAGGVAPTTAGATRAGGGGQDPRLLPAVLVLLVAVAAATMFLDMRLGEEVQSTADEFDTLAASLGDQDQRMRGLVERLDGAAESQDIQALRTELRSMQQAQSDRDGLLTQRMHQHLVAVEGLDRRLEAVRDGIPDHSGQLASLGEDLRLLKLAMEELLARPTAPAGAVPGPTPEGRGDEIIAPEGAGADAALAPHIAKLTHEDPGTRFVAVDELLRQGGGEVLVHILPMVEDDDAFVRRLTAEGLGTFEDPRAVDALLAAMADEEEIVRSTAFDSAMRLTGEKIPFDPAGSRDARSAGLRRWQQWWEKNRATFE